jgi:hypothetical protein
MATMPCATTDTEHPRAVGILDRLKTRLAIMAVMITGLVASASAEMCWTTITDILAGISTYMLPSLLDLVTGVIPLLIVLAVVGFVMKFLDKILDMLSMR